MTLPLVEGMQGQGEGTLKKISRTTKNSVAEIVKWN